MSPSGRGRLRRVNESLRQIISEALNRDVSDPRLELVTVTQVHATQDLKEATVYWTTLDAGRRERAAAALDSARGVIQGRIGRELRSRQTPHLRFVHDEHQERAAGLTRLIDEVTSDLPPGDEA